MFFCKIIGQKVIHLYYLKSHNFQCGIIHKCIKYVILLRLIERSGFIINCLSEMDYHFESIILLTLVAAFATIVSFLNCWLIVALKLPFFSFLFSKSLNHFKNRLSAYFLISTMICMYICNEHVISFTSGFHGAK